MAKASAKRRLLLIDDDDDLLLLLERTLVMSGYAVEKATDGEAGLRLLLTRSYDLAIVDLGLPKVGGLEILWRLRGAGLVERTPVVFLSGRGGPEIRARGFALGAEDYIPKPVDPIELRTRLRHVFERLEKTAAASRPARVAGAGAEVELEAAEERAEAEAAGDGDGDEEAARSGGSGVSGALGDVLVGDLVQLFCLRGRDGYLDVTSDPASGKIAFRKGEVIDATLERRPKASAEEAFFELFRLKRGTYECRFEPVTAPARTSGLALTILLEAATALDPVDAERLFEDCPET